MAKSKPEPAAKDEDWEFELPPFDEHAFIRREVQGAKISFWTLGLGFVAGVLAYATSLFSVDWRLGWIPILAIMGGLRPLLQRLDFTDEATETKAMLGNYFMLIFTALGIWILGVNLL